MADVVIAQATLRIDPEEPDPEWKFGCKFHTQSGTQEQNDMMKVMACSCLVALSQRGEDLETVLAEVRQEAIDQLAP